MPKVEGFIAEVSPDLLTGSLSVTPLQVTARGHVFRALLQDVTALVRSPKDLSCSGKE